MNCQQSSSCIRSTDNYTKSYCQCMLNYYILPLVFTLPKIDFLTLPWKCCLATEKKRNWCYLYDIQTGSSATFNHLHKKRVLYKNYDHWLFNTPELCITFQRIYQEILSSHPKSLPSDQLVSTCSEEWRKKHVS